MPDPSPATKQHIFQPPTGTRDLYPIEAARRRYITEAWRKVSINHGFEEIDGPTFEHLDLYKVKSGEGIVNELFSFTRAGGEKNYALRPEFTPTLARMYAAKAASLPKPTKWFSVGPYFRAERPQRGRLREFLQWNCDVIGLTLPESPTPADVAVAKTQSDVEVIICCIGLLSALGLTPAVAQVKLNSRLLVSDLLKEISIAPNRHDAALAVLDKRGKISEQELQSFAGSLGLPATFVSRWNEVSKKYEDFEAVRGTTGEMLDRMLGLRSVIAAWDALNNAGYADWIDADSSIARGLAYYTGTVFEVIVDGERAIAGGGRYDNLIELFGGPPTPAVGFGMGDVVLANVLQDKDLMPTDAELLGLAGQHPDAFVISNGTPEADAALPKVLADLRRSTPAHGSESRATPGLHTRRSYKTTKNFGKILQEAAKSNSRFAVIIESATEATIKDLATNQQDQSRTPLTGLAAELRKRLG